MDSDAQYHQPEQGNYQINSIEDGKPFLGDTSGSHLANASPNTTVNMDADSQSPLQYLKHTFRAGSMKGSIFTLITATIGTGILLIPNSLSASGIWWGFMQFTFCGWLGYYSLMICIDCAEKAKAYSYQELAQKTYGFWNKVGLNGVFFFANWGTVVAYLVLTCQLIATSLSILSNHGEAFPEWLKWSVDSKSKILPVVVTTIFVVPLSLPKELKSLRYFCLLSFLFVLYLVGVVIGESFTYYPPLSANWADVKGFVFAGASTTFPTGVFAYMCHPNVLDVYRELNNPTRRRMRKVIIRTIMIVFFTYTFVGSFGYVGFARNLATLSDPHKANGIILIGYGFDPVSGEEDYFNIPVSVCILLIAFSVTIAMPLCIKPAKDSLRDLIYPNEIIGPDQDPMSRHVPLVLFSTYSAMLCAMYVPGMQKVINILGSSFFTMICFLYPSSFYLKLFKDKKKDINYYFQYVMFGCMTVFAIWSTYENLAN